MSGNFKALFQKNRMTYEGLLIPQLLYFPVLKLKRTRREFIVEDKIVCGKKDSCSAFCNFEQQVHDLGRRFGIKVSCRLIGQDDLGRVY